jgi:hypothetical protein
MTRLRRAASFKVVSLPMKVIARLGVGREMIRHVSRSFSPQTRH